LGVIFFYTTILNRELAVRQSSLAEVLAVSAGANISKKATSLRAAAKQSQYKRPKSLSITISVSGG